MAMRDAAKTMVTRPMTSLVPAQFDSSDYCINPGNFFHYPKFRAALLQAHQFGREIFAAYAVHGNR
jgi:hypothetical protein